MKVLISVDLQLKREHKPLLQKLNHNARTKSFETPFPHTDFINVVNLARKLEIYIQSINSNLIFSTL